MHFTSTTIQDSTISGNNASNGGGVWANPGYSGTTTIQNCTVSGNTANGDGGGIWAVTWGNRQATRLQNTTVSDNTAAANGGGIWVSTSTLGMTIIQQSSVSGNTSDKGGGIFMRDEGGSALVFGGGGMTVQDTTISGNTGREGGGIYAYSYATGNTLIENVTVTGNTADDGGGMYVSSSGNIVTIENSTFSGNTAAHNGGGSALNQFRLSRSLRQYDHRQRRHGRWRRILGDDLRGQRRRDPRQHHLGNNGKNGGGIWASTGSGSFSLEDSTIFGNTAAHYGGGVYAANNLYGTTTIQQSTISGNSASYGGGIASKGYGTTVQNSTITDNGAYFGGGGLYSYSGTSVTIRSTIIAANSDDSSTAPDVLGSADIAYSLLGDDTGATLTDSGNNLIGDPTGSGVIDPISGRWPTTAGPPGPAPC